MPARKASPSLGPRIGATCVMAIFLAFGLGFLGLMGRDIYRTLQTRRWPSVPCEIVMSRVTARRNDYQWIVDFRYEFSGKTWYSKQAAITAPASSNYASMQRLADQYPRGAKVQCFVDPGNPASAILRQAGFGIIAFAFIPLIFVAVGAVGICGVWRVATPKVATASATSPMDVPVLSDMITAGETQSQAPPSTTFIPRKPRRRGNPTIAFVLFTIIGGLMFYIMSVRVFLDIESAKHWIATPCVVKSSRVQTHTGDRSTTYSADILYAYIKGGREYRSNRYDFMAGSSSNYDASAAIARRFPIGRRTTCYVNPSDSTDAVLERGFTSDSWLGLIPLAFLLMGIIGLLARWRSRSAIRHLAS